MEIDFLNALYSPIGGTGTFNTLGGILNIFLPVLYLIAGILLLASILIAAFKMMTGQKKGLEEAKKMLKNSLIGLVIIALAWIVTLAIANWLGVDSGLS